MRKLLLFTLCAMLVGGGAAVAMTLDEALALFPGTDIMIPYNDEGRATLEAMLEAFREALGVPADLDEMEEMDVTNFEVAAELKDVVNKLSQALYTYSDAFLAGDPEERNTYLKGRNWGFKSLRMSADFVAIEGEPADSWEEFVDAVNQETDLSALYWAGANWLRWGEFNPLQAVAALIPQQTNAISLRCIELDETYMNYGSYRALGAFWAGLPRMPLGNWRKNFSRSLGYFCHIVDEPEICADWDCDVCPPLDGFDPAANEYLENRVFFVEFYVMQREMWEDAKRILDQVLTEPIGETYPLYNAISLEKAATFLAEVEEKL